jgi:ABC-type multidrug transport system fused ATPase/permease subunit
MYKLITAYMTLGKLLKEQRAGIIFIVALVILENLAWVFEPAIFGKLIDAFLDKVAVTQPGIPLIRLINGVVAFPLFLWVMVYAVNSSAGSTRRLMEPRIFQKILTILVTRLTEEGRKIKLEAGKIAGRAQLSQEIVSFFQYRIPEIAEHVIAVGGAIMALTLFDWRISAACLLVTLPLVWMGKIYNRRVSVYQKNLHDDYEKMFDTFSGLEPGKVQTLYRSMADNQKKIANWSAFNFGSLRVVLLFIFLFVLYISIDMDDFTTGKVFSIVSYLWTFISSVEYIPDLMESRTSLRDISNRLNINTEA